MDQEKAWQLIYDFFNPDYKGSDDEDVFWLSVALYQWQNGILIEEVKQRALQCIDDESYLEVWKESDSATYKMRIIRKHWKLAESRNIHRPSNRKLRNCANI